MDENSIQTLPEVSESLLLPLYIRALETQRPDALLKDEWAVELIQKLKLEAAFFDQAQLTEEVKVSILLRNRQFDQITRNYLNHHPEGVVVHLGCGLDARFERLDNGQVAWYDLDLAEVIAIRRKFLGGESCRYQMLAGSVLDRGWMWWMRISRVRFSSWQRGCSCFSKPVKLKNWCYQ